MPETIIQPDTLLNMLIFIPIISIFIGILLGRSIEQVQTKRRRYAGNGKHSKDGMRSSRTAWNEQPTRLSAAGGQLRATVDAADQLRIVLEAKFAARPILNRGETRVFKELKDIVGEYSPAWQVMAQVSLGEILQCKDSQAFSCINSKRVDLLLVDENCMPRHVVEYHGAGHYQGSAAARDAVKKEALRKAGITYHEVVAGRTTPSDLRRLVEKLVDKTHMTEMPVTMA